MTIRRLLGVAVCFAGLAVLVACEGVEMPDMINGPGTSESEARVRGILENMKRGGTSASTEEQTATCLWFNGKAFISDLPTLERAVDGFADWRIEKDLMRKIDSYEIVSAEAQEGEVAIVKVKIDGSDYTMRVTPKRPIEWVD